MKLLYVSTYYKPAFAYGGPVAVVSALCEELARSNVEVSVYTTNANGRRQLDVPVGQLVEIEGVNVTYHSVSSVPLGLNYSQQLYTSVKQNIHNYDIAIIDGIWSITSWKISKLVRKIGIPFIAPLHGQLMPWALHQKALKKHLFLIFFTRQMLNGARALHAASYAEAVALEKLRFKPPVFTIPYGIDLQRFSTIRPQGFLYRKFSIPIEHRIIACVGRLHPVKNPDISVKAWTLLKASDVHLVFIGPDESGLRDDLFKIAYQAGCDERLHFTGLLSNEEVVNALVDVDLLLMPSVMESFGNAALEAMAAGVPVLVSDQVPIGHWVENANAGKVVPPTVEKFSKAIEELLGSPEKLREMGSRGKEVAFSEFDISVVTNRLLANMQAIVDTGEILSNEPI